MFNMRAEKSTRNRDDFKVLLVGSIITILLMLIGPLAPKAWDEVVAERPFMRASVEVVYAENRYIPMIRYQAVATKPVDATWIATIESLTGSRFYTRRGTGSYSVLVPGAEPVLWTWEAFFDNELGYSVPKVPQERFQVCVRYIAIVRTTRVIDESPKYCSNFFNP